MVSEIRKNKLNYVFDTFFGELLEFFLRFSNIAPNFASVTFF